MNEVERLIPFPGAVMQVPGLEPGVKVSCELGIRSTPVRRTRNRTQELESVARDLEKLVFSSASNPIFSLCASEEEPKHQDKNNTFCS
jgi:hypothetical protein